VALAVLALRMHPRALAFFVMVVWVALIAVAAVANSLTYSVTI